jgi:predicted 2-oxoglutarate/Fe(II)-dependent dioxygenase YbiX
MKVYNTTPLTPAVEFFSGKSFGHEEEAAPVVRHDTPPTPPPYDTPVNSHSSIMIIPNFLSAEDCRFLVNYAEDKIATDLSVFDPEKANSSKTLEWSTDKETRNTQMVEYDESLASTFTNLIAHAVKTHINPYFNIELQSAEQVQFLKYGVGGHYKPHPDGEALWHEKDTNRLVWKKNIERDISILIYLNSEYEGGQLIFPDQHITLNPKPGMLVAFPSTHCFMHGVTPVTSGVRYALVSWASCSVT